MRVDFQIDRVARLPCAEQGAAQGFGNQVDAERVFADAAYGQAASVEADEAFGQDVGFKRGGQGEVHRGVVLGAFNAEDFGGGGDVAAHQMAADFVAEAGGAFEIDQVARFQTA